MPINLGLISVGIPLFGVEELGPIVGTVGIVGIVGIVGSVPLPTKCLIYNLVVHIRKKSSFDW